MNECDRPPVRARIEISQRRPFMYVAGTALPVRARIEILIELREIFVPNDRPPVRARIEIVDTPKIFASASRPPSREGEN